MLVVVVVWWVVGVCGVGVFVGGQAMAEGVYVFEVGDVKTDDKQTAEGEKVRAQAMAEGMAQQFAIPAIQQMAKIQDLRGKYF